jgi:hypothetical protein
MPTRFSSLLPLILAVACVGGGAACSSATTTEGSATETGDGGDTGPAGDDDAGGAAATDAAIGDAGTSADAADAAPAPVSVVKGNPAAPAACDTICATTTRACVPDHEWSRSGGGTTKAGCHATYVRAATGGAVDTVFGCSDIPPAQKTLANFPRDLERFECACR